MNIEEQDFYQKVGARVREIRTQKKLSQSELAVKASLSLPHISAIELGKKAMKLETLVRVAEALEVSTDYLLRPNSPAVNTIYPKEFEEVLGDCSPDEVESIVKVAKEIKSSLRKAKNN